MESKCIKIEAGVIDISKVLEVKCYEMQRDGLSSHMIGYIPTFDIIITYNLFQETYNKGFFFDGPVTTTLVKSRFVYKNKEDRDFDYQKIMKALLEKE